MVFPAFVARLIPWSAAAQAGMQLARLGMDYKLERDKLREARRAKDVEGLEARLDAVEKRFEGQLRVMQELAGGLEREVGRMRRGIVVSSLAAAGAAVLSVVALLVVLL